MAASSRPYEIPPVLVRRDVPRMAATSTIIQGQDGRIGGAESQRGATRLQQSNANVNGTGERPPPTKQPIEMQDELLSLAEQSSLSSISTPTDSQETTLQALSAPLLSMDASSTLLPELVASTSTLTPTFQVDISTMNGTTTIRAASTTIPTFLVDSGAKINEDALPGMNQEDPALVTVPGMNQEDPLLVTAPAVTPLTAPEGPLATSSTFVMTVDKPMPGKNQPNPTVDAASVSLTSLSYSSSTIVPTSSTPSSTTSTAISTVADVSTISFSILPTLAISALSTTEPSTTTSSSVLPPVLTFVTITRTAQGKEDAQTSTQTVPAPLAITAPQSLASSLLVSSLVVGSAVPSSLATAVSVEPQSGLTPLARSLFILFGVLGFVTILITLGIIWVMRSNKRRTQAARQQAAQSPVQEAGGYDVYGNTIRIFSNSSSKAFLTESEKAIVNRAAAPGGDTDASARPSNALTEAIHSFITKSRRLTYKISP